MKTKIYSALFLFTILIGFLSYAAIPVKRELVKDQTNSNVEFVDNYLEGSASELESDIPVVVWSLLYGSALGLFGKYVVGADIDWTAFLLCWFLGIFGAHRFYMGDTGIAIAQLLTLGGLGIWAGIDFIRIATGNLP